jgi:hypothetical protein
MGLSSLEVLTNTSQLSFFLSKSAGKAPTYSFFIDFLIKKYVQGGGRMPQGEKEKELSETAAWLAWQGDRGGGSP